jgi:hypothetical protein
MESPIKLRRRWFTYSLRGLLLAISVACCVLAWRASVAHERMHLLKMIRERGGVIGLDSDVSGCPGKPETMVYRETLMILLISDEYSPEEIARIRRAFPDDDVSVAISDPDGENSPAPPPPPIPASKSNRANTLANRPDRADAGISP